MNGHLLPLRSDSFTVYLVQDGDTTVVGAVEDRLSAHGDSLVRIYSEVNAVIGTLFDTIVSSAGDLRPLAFHSRASSHLASLTYDSAGVKGWVVPTDGDTQAVAVRFPSPVYDGTAFDLVARASPLGDGVRLSVPAFLYESGVVTTIHGGVVGGAMVDGRSCWIFTAQFDGMPVTLWIDKASRALRRQLLQLPDGAGLLYVRPPRPASSERES